MNKVPEKLEDPRKFLIPCALQELDRTSALADSGASINLLPHSIYKQLGLEALTPTRMTLELANRSITHPMGIAEDFADELAPLDSLPPGNDDSTLKKDVQEGNFQVYLNTLFEFEDNFKSSTINPLFVEMEEDVKIKNSNVSDEPVLLNTPLSDKVECFAPEDNNDEIDAFLAMEISSNFEEGYFDSEGDVTFLDNLLSDDASHNLTSEFAGELLTLPSRNDHEFGEYLSLMTVLCEISTSQSQENVHANQSSVIESLPVSPIPIEDSEPAQGEIDIFLVPDDLIPPGVENDNSEDEDNELPNLDRQDDPSIPRPPPELPDVAKCFEPGAGTDISKITRKPSKTGKHGHEKRKNTREAKDSKPKPEKVKLQSNGQPWST
ncbi:reverse transcriptase domain-containing protein [Tanacetum coccineum]|uniref:Reverse transcriptase domain-containing protein n=1 Tax=Tanacetum coccineum TaxID=301880 RepID=A0ABQ5F4T4_9ASTR